MFSWTIWLMIIPRLISKRLSVTMIFVLSDTIKENITTIDSAKMATSWGNIVRKTHRPNRVGSQKTMRCSPPVYLMRSPISILASSRQHRLRGLTDLRQCPLFAMPSRLCKVIFFEESSDIIRRLFPFKIDENGGIQVRKPWLKVELKLN
jgi:hypothetical protein